MLIYHRNGVTVELGDSLELLRGWSSPTVIVADGPYGLGSFKGDLRSVDGLAEWYKPHAEAWASRATPQTTLWFWNSELGWATVHPILTGSGWQYRSCHTWDKGLGHVAGNCNTQTLRKFPVVTELCVQYVREARVHLGGTTVGLKEWLRSEWRRSGLPFSKANAACGVTNAATRKYLTACHLWYMPPPGTLAKLIHYANRNGRRAGRPYFSTDGKRPLNTKQIECLQAKFACPMGVTNVWREPQVKGKERVRKDGRAVHMNQKPLRLIEMLLTASSDPGDVVWEPFGGLCTAAVASHRLGRKCHSAEILPDYCRMAGLRLMAEATPKRSSDASDR